MIKYKTIIIVISLFYTSFIQAITTVGNGNDCGYNLQNGDTLQDAISLPGSFDIRLMRNITYAGATINKPISIKGGFDNCTDASNNILSNQTNLNAIISGFNTSRVFEINSTTFGNILLKHLTIINGNAIGGTGGGINATEQNFANIIIENCDIHSNTAVKGGGILFNGGALRKLFIQDTMIHNNNAFNNAGIGSQGGGLHLSRVETTIVGNSGIYANSADSNTSVGTNGGGIYASSSNITIVAGDDSPNVGIFNNTSGQEGGGIFLIDSLLELNGGKKTIAGFEYGNNQSPMKLAFNSSTNRYGGAIYAIFSDISIYSSVFSLNTANVAGGAIGLIGTDISIQGDPTTCWRDQGCNVFNRNTAQFGGAIWAIQSSQATIEHTLFTDNSANTGTSIAISNTNVTLESSVIYQDGVTPTAYSNNNVTHTSTSMLTILYSNIIENSTTDSVFDSINSGGTEVFNSIVYNDIPGLLGINAGTSVNNYNCTLANTVENGSIDIGFQNYSGLFVNSTFFNFRLKPNTYAIDFCDNLDAPANTTDLQGITRGIPDPRPDVFGIFDAGANEYNDVIFINGFET